jgi:hypothetical protein
LESLLNEERRLDSQPDVDIAETPAADDRVSSEATAPLRPQTEQIPPRSTHGRLWGRALHVIERHLSLLLGTAFVLLTVLVLPVLYYLWLIQQTNVVVRAVDPGTLYALVVPGAVHELEKDRSLRALDGTVLALDRGDITRILTTTFSEDDVLRKAAEAIKSVRESARTGSRDTFMFWIPIARERPMLDGYLIKYFHYKLVARPECSMGKFLGIAWTQVQRFFGKHITQDEQLARLPHCRPPKAVQKAVMNAVAVKLQRSETHAADSVLARPNFSPNVHRWIRRSLVTGQTDTRFFFIPLALLAIIIMLSWRDRKACYARVAAPLLISSMLLLIINVPLFFYARDLDLLGTVYKLQTTQLSEGTGQWLQVVFYVLKSVARVAAANLALWAGFMMLAGLIVLRQHQRSRLAEEQCAN